ncbi:hypothetical protein V7024_01570 [Bacillus sp. JJ864]|uniref:hypothetical protein n=1 Tax=Bacillus sp. JJ864 TaxID=3122975 RepID=UPI0030007BCA
MKKTPTDGSFTLLYKGYVEGLEAGRKMQKKLGRPTLEKDKLSIALRMYDSQESPIKEIVERTGFQLLTNNQ